MNKKRRRRHGQRMSKADVKHYREHLRVLKITRPDIDWDAVTAESERLFGPILPKPSRLAALRTAVYLISSQESGPTKVGVAIDVNKRLGQLQAGHPWPLQVRALVWFADQKSALAAERWLLGSAGPDAWLTGEWLDKPASELERALQQYLARQFDHELGPLDGEGDE